MFVCFCGHLWRKKIEEKNERILVGKVKKVKKGVLFTEQILKEKNLLKITVRRFLERQNRLDKLI